MNLLCPVCRNQLIKKDKIYSCKNNHVFDVAKEGYVNLLMSNKKNSLLPGDNKQMVNARETFLNEGYYLNLVNKIIETISKYKKSKINILDVGCGTGYYSIQVKKNRNLSDELIGLDISKFAVAKAAKKDNTSTFIVASSFDIPCEDESVDVILNIFSPKANEEFLRVLKRDGILIEVMPGASHMIELKEKIYSAVRLNEVNIEYEGFNLKESNNLKYTIHLDSNEKIKSHIQMTPYYYKSSTEDLKKLDNLDTIDVTIDFYINVWTKK